MEILIRPAAKHGASFGLSAPAVVKVMVEQRAESFKKRSI
jgi:hypothetical protein